MFSPQKKRIRIGDDGYVNLLDLIIPHYIHRT
jgi:hypothetical protein